MPYLTCPQCHASFHTGLLYTPGDSCPRCGVPFRRARRHFLRTPAFGHKRADDAVDWEAITEAQYADRQYVSQRHRRHSA